MGGVFAAIGYAVSMAFALFWQIFWALEFGISAVRYCSGSGPEIGHH